MEYKVSIFSFVLIAGILGSCLLYEHAFPSDPEDAGGELSIGSKNGVQWEGLFLSHTVSTVKKCSTSLFLERIKPLLLSRPSHGLYFKSFFPSWTVNILFDQISINAP